jgi:hypothetical protein
MHAKAHGQAKLCNHHAILRKAAAPGGGGVALRIYNPIGKKLQAWLSRRVKPPWHAPLFCVAWNLQNFLSLPGSAP